MRSTALITLPAAALAVASLAVSFSQGQGAAKSLAAGRAKEQKLKDAAGERDREIEGSSESHGEYWDLESLTEGADAIVHGRIIDSRSFWDESGHPIEYGENITTEYAVDVYRVFKDKTRNVTPSPGEPSPAPVTTPLKISRNGGAVYVNGHRASVRVKQYDSLNTGKQYVFFLDWSRDYKSFILAGGASGAVMVDDDESLKPLASSEKIQTRLRGITLQSLADELGLKR